ncbi:MAG: hypothetical protein RIR97_738 [Pseudomonadota bacterium]
MKHWASDFGDHFWSEDIFDATMSDEGHRHEKAKQTFKVTNWVAYTESFHQRGDLTVWIGDDVLSKWVLSPTPHIYSICKSVRLSLNIVKQNVLLFYIANRKDKI